MDEQKNDAWKKKFDDGFIFSFDFLRQHAIELLQHLSGNIWTDYNLHDPGVTILEHLCFAFTDLVYRTNFPIQDILAEPDGKIDIQKNSFFPSSEILTIHPVSINDKRKYIIDVIHEVENIWIEPISEEGFKGIYKTIVQLNKDLYPQINKSNDEEDKNGDPDAKKEDTHKKLAEKILNKLIATRNLCEDFEDVVILEPEFIEIAADIMIENGAVPEEVLADIHTNLENVLTPVVKYATAEELKKNGLSIEEIYNGPNLVNGIITDDQLKPLKVLIDPIEFVKKILEVKGILNIKNFKLKVGKNIAGKTSYRIDEKHFPFLLYKPGNVKFYRNNNNILLPFQENVFKNRYYKIKQVTKKDFIAALHKNALLLSPEGKWRNLKKYYSIQHFFPGIYALEEGALPSDTPLERRAYVKQIKGYLMLFEQTLLNYLAQLSNVSNFFSPHLSLDETRSTLYYQPPFDLPGANSIIAISDKSSTENDNKKNDFIKDLRRFIETDDAYRKKKNAIFDHLLARFNLSLPPLPVARYEKYYGQDLSENGIDRTLQWKASLLTKITDLGYFRFKAFNYKEAYDKIKNHTGFKKNLYSFLYIATPLERSLTDNFKKEEIIIKPETRQKEHGIKQTIHKIKIGPDKEDIIEIIDDHADYLLSNNDAAHTKDGAFIKNFFFKEQTISVFQTATEKENYKLLPDPIYKSEKERRTILIFKITDTNNNNNNKWRIISRHTLRTDGETLLAKLINYFRQISISSEGFHIVDHLLMRPSPDEHVFRYAITNEDGKIIIWQRAVSAFAKNRKAAKELIQKIAAVNSTPSNDELTKSFEDWEIVEEKNNNGIRHYSAVNADTNKLLQVFNLIKQRVKRNPNPEKLMCCIIKQSGSLFIDKNFFSNKLSFIFPVWPARFQDVAYKNFATNFINTSCPVYIQPIILWFNIHRMQQFEKHYFEWLELLRSDSHTRKNSVDLIQLIAEEKYLIRTNAVQ